METKRWPRASRTDAFVVVQLKVDELHLGLLKRTHVGTVNPRANGSWLFHKLMDQPSRAGCRGRSMVHRVWWCTVTAHLVKLEEGQHNPVVNLRHNTRNVTDAASCC